MVLILAVHRRGISVHVQPPWRMLSFLAATNLTVDLCNQEPTLQGRRHPATSTNHPVGRSAEIHHVTMLYCFPPATANSGRLWIRKGISRYVLGKTDCKETEVRSRPAPEAGIQSGVTCECLSVQCPQMSLPPDPGGGMPGSMKVLGCGG